MKKLLLLLLVLFTTHAQANCTFVETTAVGVRSSSAGRVFQDCLVKSSSNLDAIYYFEVDYNSHKILHTIYNGKLISTEKL